MVNKDKINEIIVEEKLPYIIVKAVVFLAFFTFLHFLYDWYPVLIVKIFSGIDESMFQHMKIGFFTYFFIFLVELILKYKLVENKSSLIYSRILSAIVLPWVMALLYYPIPGLFYPFAYVVEIIYAITITFILGIMLAIFDSEMKEVEFTLRLKIILLFLLVVSTFIFIYFTFFEPPFDVFQEVEI